MSMPGFGGVFDLSTLKKEPEPVNEAGQPSLATIPGPWVLTLTEKNLESTLQTSMSLPVIVVFAAPESEHSQTLISQLTNLITKRAGRIQLAVVDTSTERGVAGAFGIQAVPSVVALLQGQPVPLFQGLPDSQAIDETLSKLLKAGEQYGLNGVLDGDPEGAAPEPEIPPLHQEGLVALEAGNLDAAHAAYTAAIKENPGDLEAKTALNQVELLQRVQAINPQNSPLEAQGLLHAAASSPLTEIDVHLQAADLELSFGHAEAAFTRLIDVIKATQGEDRDLVRTRLLALFDIVGQHSPSVHQARKALTNALF